MNTDLLDAATTRLMTALALHEDARDTIASALADMYESGRASEHARLRDGDRVHTPQGDGVIFYIGATLDDGQAAAHVVLYPQGEARGRNATFALADLRLIEDGSANRPDWWCAHHGEDGMDTDPEPWCHGCVQAGVTTAPTSTGSAD